jgi:hypothetical protein
VILKHHRKGGYKKKTDKEAWFLRYKYFKGLGLKKLPLHIQRLFYFYTTFIIYICLAAVFSNPLLFSSCESRGFFCSRHFYCSLKDKAQDMTKEEEYEMLKTRMIKAYTDYINAAQKTSINDLNDWNKRRRLIENFTLSVEANTAYRRFISKYKTIEPPKSTE